MTSLINKQSTLRSAQAPSSKKTFATGGTVIQMAPRYISFVIIPANHNEGRLNDSTTRGHETSAAPSRAASGCCEATTSAKWASKTSLRPLIRGS